MRQFGFALALVIAMLGLASAAPAVENAETRAALERGRALEAAFDYQGAYTAYRAAALHDTTTYELWWRLAKVASDRGQRFEFDEQKSRAEAAYAEAVSASRRAVRLDPEGWEGHAELAANLGRDALFEGGKTRIQLSKEVKVEADRAIALNPRADRAYHVLARWNRGIAQLSFIEKAAAKVIYGGVPEGASMNNAVTLFEKAIAIDPNYANHRLELGRTYLALGLKDKAREQLERAIASPHTSPFDAEYKSEAQILLRKTH
jgi:tetratricopeptide (TPR) repeat protein